MKQLSDWKKNIVQLHPRIQITLITANRGISLFLIFLFFFPIWLFGYVKNKEPDYLHISLINLTPIKHTFTLILGNALLIRVG